MPQFSTERSRASWFWQLVRNEMVPYPGRTARVLQVTLAVVLTGIVALTFHIPGAALGAYYPLLLRRDTPRATLRASLLTMVFCGFATIWVVLGAILVLGSPLVHFLWVIFTLFFVFWLIDVVQDYGAGSGFGFVATVGIATLDGMRAPELKIELTLYVLLAIAIGCAINVAVQYAFHRKPVLDGLHQGLLIRLDIIGRTLAALGEGSLPGPKLHGKLMQYSMIGNGQLRQMLARLGYPAIVRGELAAAIALIGTMIDLTVEMVSTHPISPQRRERLAAVARSIERLRVSIAASTQPQILAPPPPRPQGTRRSPTFRLEFSTAILTQVFSSELEAEYFAAHQKQQPTSYFKSDAFSNPEHIRFAIRGGLAASFCYMLYVGLDWPGLTTALPTCLLTALASTGASRQKQLLRVVGTVIGGVVFALGAQVFILPRMNSIGGFSILLAIVTFISAWIFTSSPRIAYSGSQMALAFYLVHLNDIRFNRSLVVTRDRVLGILLGVMAMWIIFDQLWFKPSGEQMVRLFDEALRLTAHFPTRAKRPLDPEAMRLRETIERNFDQARDASDAVLFEFRKERTEDLIRRDRVRAWQPLLRINFLLRLALYRRTLPDGRGMADTGLDDPRVARALDTSTRILDELTGAVTAKRRPHLGDEPVFTQAPIPIPRPDAPPAVHLAASLEIVTAYLREEVLTDIATR